MKQYKDSGITVAAKATDKQIEILTNDQSKGTLTLEGDILTSNLVIKEPANPDDFTAVLEETANFALLAQIVIDIFTEAQVLQGQDRTTIVATMNSPESLTYKVDVNYFEKSQSSDGKTITVKMNINQKMTLIDMNKEEYSYVTADVLSSNGSIKEKSSSIYSINRRVLVDVNDFFDDETTILIYEKDALTDNAYKSLITVITALYDANEANNFKAKYNSFSLGDKQVGAYKIDVDPELSGLDKPSDWASNKAVKITIDKKAI